VEEAAKHEAEDKARFERVEARNGLESYLYNVRNSLQEEKVKEKLGNTEVATALESVKEEIEWLESHGDEEKATYEERQRAAEDKLRPIMMKLYAGGAAGGEAAPDAEPPSGPKVEEVD